ncbi:hypothetical protein CAJAP_05098 [Camponotus japonicus]
MNCQKNATSLIDPNETWLDCRDSINIKSFDVIRKDRIGRRGGGVLIFVQSTLKYSIIDDVSDCQSAQESCGIEFFSDLDEWKRYLVFFIPKQGEDAKFHSISLASCLSKILKRMIVCKQSELVPGTPQFAA